MTLQCSLASQPVPVPDADGTPLPRLNWDDSRREAYVQALDGCALDACAMLAAQGSIPQACEQLSATVLAAAQTSGCRFKPAVPAGPPRTQKRREHKPFFDRECRDLKRLYQHTRSRDPEQAHVLLRKYASVVRRKCRIYRQLQTDTLLREIRSRPRDFWRKLNGKPAALPRALQQQSKWQQYMADLCAPASSVPPPPSTSAPTGAQQLASGLNDAITSGEVQAALPLLNNGRSCAKSGWPAELLRYAYKEVTMEDGKVSKLYVLAPILAALLDSAFQSGTLPDAVKSSLITPVFKKGDKFDPSNYRPIAVGEPLCRLYAAILNSRIVNWAESNGLRAPCQAGFRPRLSTEHQLFALRHFIDRSKSQKQPLFAAFVDLKKAYDSVQHPLLWASLQLKGIHGKMLAGVQSLYDGGEMSMKISGSYGASSTARVGVRQGCPTSPTLFGIFFDSLHTQLQAESAAAGVECRGARVPGLFYADDVALLSPSAQGLQQLLDTMQSFCSTNGLTISIPKTEVVVFGGGHLQCQWHVGAIASSVVNVSYIWACCFMRTGTSNTQSSIAWLEAMRPRGACSHATPGLAVPILSSSFCDCNRQFYSLVLPMRVRCGLQPRLALALSESLSSSRAPSSAELAV